MGPVFEGGKAIITGVHLPPDGGNTASRKIGR